LFLLSRVVSASSLLPCDGGELPGAVRERFMAQGRDPKLKRRREQVLTFVLAYSLHPSF
jgi:hypothetical protein